MGKPRNTRHTQKYPKVKEIPGNTWLYFLTLLLNPNLTRYPVFCPISDPTRYWKTLPAGHWSPLAKSASYPQISIAKNEVENVWRIAQITPTPLPLFGKIFHFLMVKSASKKLWAFQYIDIYVQNNLGRRSPPNGHCPKEHIHHSKKSLLNKEWYEI